MVVFDLNDVMFVRTALIACLLKEDKAGTLGCLEREKGGGFDPAHTVVRGANHSYC